MSRERRGVRDAGGQSGAEKEGREGLELGVGYCVVCWYPGEGERSFSGVQVKA